MATRKKTGFSLEKLVLFVFIGGLIGFFIGRATAPKSDGVETEKVAPVAVAKIGQLHPKDTGKALQAVSSPYKGAAEPLVVIHEVSEFQ